MLLTYLFKYIINNFLKFYITYNIKGNKILTTMESRLLRISSTDRSSDSVSKYNITYHGNDPDMQLIHKVVLKSAIIPNSQYNINLNNNTLIFPNTLSASPYTIPAGQYTITELITAIEGLITGLTITQDAITQKLTFAMAGGTFDIIVDGNLMAPILGFDTLATSTALYTSDNLPDLSGLNNIYVASQKLSSERSMLTVDKGKINVFCDIAMDVPFGATKTLAEDETSLDFTEFDRRKNISTLDIKLLDEKNNVIDLNGLEWELVFRIYY